jgi:hypothetical protein
MKLFLVLIIGIFYTFDSSNACICNRINPEQHYCGAEFLAVMKIGARHADTEKLRVYYEVEVKQVLKATEKAKKSLKSNRLVTMNGDDCGIYFLTEGQDLVVTGHVDYNGEPRILLCDYHDLWSSVTPQIKAGFLGGYKCSST